MDRDTEKVIESIRKKPYFIAVRDIIDVNSLLDIGCGNGLVTYALGLDKGIEISQCDIKDTRHPTVLQLPFQLASIDKLPYGSEEFDYAYVQFVLHHINPESDIGEIFNGLKRVVKKGIIIHEEIATPKTDLARARSYDEEMNRQFQPENPLEVFRYYTREEIENLGKDSGLNLERHLVLKKGTERDDFLQKHLFYFARDNC